VGEAEFELERSYDAVPVAVRPFPGEGTPPESPASAAPPSAGLPLVPDDDEPVLEADAVEDEAPAAAAPAAREPAPEAEPMLLEPDVVDEEFDVPPPTPAVGTPRVTFRHFPPDPAAPPPPQPALASPAAGNPAPPAAGPVATPPAELASPTLAELYFDQGFPDKAVEVYRRLLERDPDNERLRGRMREIEARTAAPVVAAAAWPQGSRQEAIGRVIEKLQDLRAALARKD
jgi:hypothetical protein